MALLVHNPLSSASLCELESNPYQKLLSYDLLSVTITFCLWRHFWIRKFGFDWLYTTVELL